MLLVLKTFSQLQLFDCRMRLIVLTLAKFLSICGLHGTGEKNQMAVHARCARQPDHCLRRRPWRAATRANAAHAQSEWLRRFCKGGNYACRQNERLFDHEAARACRVGGY